MVNVNIQNIKKDSARPLDDQFPGNLRSEYFGHLKTPKILFFLHTYTDFVETAVAVKF